MSVILTKLKPRYTILNDIVRYKMASVDVLKRLESKATAAEQLIAVIKSEVEELKKNRKSLSAIGTSDLAQENERLRKEVERYKNELIRLETLHGVVQVPVKQVQANLSESIKKIESEIIPMDGNTDVPIEKKESKPKKEKIVKEKKVAAPKESEEPPIDVGRLDFRVGKIVDIQKHPDADSLYVEQIDVGEGKNRTVVSGLVKYVPIEEMRDKLVVVLCNLKPSKMRGVTSEAMVMCASTPEKVEVLTPPSGAVPGDLVHVEGYPRAPDSILNPKKKIFETCAPDLKTDDNKQATYKGVPLHVPGKGAITTPSLIQVQVK